MEVAHGFQAAPGTLSVKGSSTATWLQELVQVVTRAVSGHWYFTSSSSASLPAVVTASEKPDTLEKSWQLSGNVLTEWCKNKPRKSWQW